MRSSRLSSCPRAFLREEAFGKLGRLLFSLPSFYAHP